MRDPIPSALRGRSGRALRVGACLALFAFALQVLLPSLHAARPTPPATTVQAEAAAQLGAAGPAAPAHDPLQCARCAGLAQARSVLAAPRAVESLRPAAATSCALRLPTPVRRPAAPELELRSPRAPPRAPSLAA